MCLVDFGVSFRMGERSSNQECTGTTAYSSPEVILYQTLGPAADMY